VGHVWGTGGVLTGFSWGRPDRKRQLGRHRRKWNDNIKMGDQEVGQKARKMLFWVRIGKGGKR